MFIKQVLKPRGFDVEDLERFMRHYMGLQELIATVGLGGKLVTPQEIRDLYKREHEELATAAVFFSASNYLAGVSVPRGCVAAVLYESAGELSHSRSGASQLREVRPHELPGRGSIPGSHPLSTWLPAAAGRDVLVGGGAAAIRQYLAPALIDEMHLAIVPVLLGGGERRFENLGPASMSTSASSMCVRQPSLTSASNGPHVSLPKGSIADRRQLRRSAPTRQKRAHVWPYPSAVQATVVGCVVERSG